MPETRELTLMFYFASDNPLAPSIVSQLKALKQAGFHPEANVVVRFDPNDNTPVHIFEVNLVNKIRAGGKHKIGSSLNPPFVRSLVEDKLWGKQKKDIVSASLKKELGDKSVNYAPPDTPAKMSGEQNPKEALDTFLDFCRKHYPARHYMLFILGHGLVVGNNMFLLDEHAPEHSLSLIELGAVLRKFKRKLDEQDAQFQLLSFHSCSMAALEVAYELQDTANYMLASQSGPFVGNWPYAEILVGIFNKIERLVTVKKGGETKKRGSSAVSKKENPETIINELVKEIWTACYLNSYDFQLAGYSFDVCLCNLNMVREIVTPLMELSAELIKGLADPVAKERILLAHWDAQTFWQDSYTDLYDFCFRLQQRCDDAKPASKRTKATMTSLQEKCEQVIRVLTSGDDNLVVRSDFTGPAYQFSHGLFVYFPWSEPSNQRFWLKEYGSYRFRDTSWRKFLDRYFQATMRQPRGYEQHSSRGFERKPGLDEALLGNIPGRNINCSAQLGKGDFMSAKQLNRKEGFWPFGDWFPEDPQDPNGKVGGDLGGSPTNFSIKNYPSFTTGTIGKEDKSGKQTPTRKRVGRKKAS